jgi:hypothetical protein
MERLIINPAPLKDSTFAERYPVPEQEAFSENVSVAFLAPMRAEFANGNLAQFLTSLNTQRGVSGKIGAIFLLNDTKQDYVIQDSSAIVDNKKAAEYLHLITEGNGDFTQFGEEYAQLAKAIQEKDLLEIKFMYQTYPNVSFGRLRLELVDAARKLFSSTQDPTEKVVHLADVDTLYQPDFVRRIERYYREPTALANISRWDYQPGTLVSSDEKREKDGTRRVLESFDTQRFKSIADNANLLLSDEYAAGSPRISGRLGYIGGRRMYRGYHQIQNEDFALATDMKRDTPLGNTGTVIIVDRAREAYIEGKGSNDTVQTDSKMRLRNQELGFAVRLMLPEMTRLRSFWISQRNNTASEAVEFKELYEVLEKVDFFSHPELAALIFGGDVQTGQSDVLGLLRDALIKDCSPVAEDFEHIFEEPSIRRSIYSRLIKGMEEYRQTPFARPTSSLTKEEKIQKFTRVMLHDAALDQAFHSSRAPHFLLPQESKEYLSMTVRLIEQRTQRLGFTSEPNFLRLYIQEQDREETVLALRRQQLRTYIDAVAGNYELASQVKNRLEPFEIAYAIEIEEIRTQMRDGRSPEEVYEQLVHMYADFFTFSHLHQNIVWAQTFSQYILRENITL